MFYSFIKLFLLLGGMSTLSTHVHSKQAYAHETHKHRALIFMHPKSESHQLKLPTGCKTSAIEMPLVSVECDQPVDEEQINSFKKLSGVKNAYPVFAPKQQSLPTRPYQANPNGSAFNSIGLCKMSHECPNGRTPFWAQERIFADLMFEELNRMKIPTGSVSIAVVDSGFDSKEAGKRFSSPKIQTFKGWENAGDPNRDENGHGTAVSSLIGGEKGIGLAPNLNLSIYRGTSAGKTGSSDSDYLQMAALKACKDGHKIINMSWGGFVDEHALFEEEKMYKDFYEHIGSMGCLIVKSAGNAARRIKRQHLNTDDALLRVEALEPSGQLADFSSNGEIIAPGQGVYTLRSMETALPSQRNMCQSQETHFIDGTSFSAPITSAIAGQVRAVLQTQPNYHKLSGENQVALINRILLASSRNKNLNAHKAVLLAEIVSSQGLHIKIPSSNELKKHVQTLSQQACEVQLPNCLSAPNCAQTRECIQSLRRHLSLCEKPSLTALNQLLRIYSNSQESDLILGLFPIAKTHPEIQETEIVRVVKKQWGDMHKRWSESDLGLQKSMHFDQSIEMLLYLSKDRTRVGLASDRDRAVLDFLRSEEFRQRLSRDYASDSESDLKRVLDVLYQSKLSLSKLEFLDILNKSKSYWISKQDLNETWDTPTTRLSLYTRLLNEVMTDTRFRDLRNEIVKMEKELGNWLINVSIKRLPSEIGFFKDFFKRNPEFATLENAFKAKGSSIASLFLIQNLDFIEQEKRFDFLLKSLKLYLTDSLMSVQDQSLLIHTSQQIKKEALLQNNSKSQAAIDEYWKTMSSKNNLSFMVTAFPSPPRDYTIDYREEILEKDLFYGNSRLKDHALRTFQVMIDSKKQRYSDLFDSTHAIDVATYYVMKEGRTQDIEELMLSFLKDSVEFDDKKHLTATKLAAHLLKSSHVNFYLRNNPRVRKAFQEVSQKTAQHASKKAEHQSLMESYFRKNP